MESNISVTRLFPEDIIFSPVEEKKKMMYLFTSNEQDSKKMTVLCIVKVFRNRSACESLQDEVK